MAPAKRRTLAGADAEYTMSESRNTFGPAGDPPKGMRSAIAEHSARHLYLTPAPKGSLGGGPESDLLPHPDASDRERIVG